MAVDAPKIKPVAELVGAFIRAGRGLTVIDHQRGIVDRGLVPGGGESIAGVLRRLGTGDYADVGIGVVGHGIEVTRG